ncbi:MAG TPA: amidohydrolase family protein [Longimicrobiales bacterium]|nr:amidohydrolase family protein [Longimicrobiales bacterium]
MALAALCCAPNAVLAQDPDAGRTVDTLRVRATAGTALFFDLTPDGRAIIIDLLGQLWSVPIDGGTARLTADTVAVGADDRQPAVSPDGRWIATRSDRPAGRGIWLHSLTGEAPRQLTDSALILGRDAGAPSWSPVGDRLAYVERGAVLLLDPVTGRREPLRIGELPDAVIDEPAWSPDGRRLLVSGPWTGGTPRPLLEGPLGAGIWEVDPTAGGARRITPEALPARAPAYSPDGRSVAYFAGDSSGGYRLVVQPLDGPPRDVATAAGLEPHRVRWRRDGRSLIFVARGRLHRVSADGGAIDEIPFVAELSVPRQRYTRRAPHLSQPGVVDSARGFSGLAIAPDGSQLAMLALGRLWLIDRRGGVRAAATITASANGLAWAPDGTRIAWTGGPLATQDLWITDLRTGAHRRVSRSGGSDSRAAWSPDGRRIAFLHNDGRVRVVSGAAEDDGTEAEGPEVPFSEIAAFSETLQWTPTGDTLLVYGMNGWPVAAPGCVRALLVPLAGEAQPVARFPCRPAHVRLAHDGTLVAVENGVITERRRTDDGWAEPHRVGGEAALHPSLSRDGTLLFVAGDGLRIRDTAGAEQHLGWPVRFTAPVPPPLLVRNVRLVPLDGLNDGALHDGALRDLLLREGRIAEIARAGELTQRPADATVLDAGGGWAIPGLIDSHAHFLSTGLASVRAALFHGVTTVREMWHPLAESAAFRDEVAAGVVTGARIVVSGPPYYPAPATVASVTSDFLWIPVDSATADRGLTLLRAFNAGHVKLRYAQTWSAAASFLARAHAFGFPAGGHCAHALALVAVGIDTHEHADGQCGDWQFGIHEDLAGLYRAAGVTVVPVIDVHDEIARAARDTLRLYAPEVRPFRAGLAAGTASAGVLRRLEGRAARARSSARLLHEAGVRLATGGDADGHPGGVPRELEALVAAGLPPTEALRAATSTAAEVLGLKHEIGRLMPGLRADIVLLDADPLEDIRNVSRIRWLIQDGRIIDREALLEPL